MRKELLLLAKSFKHGGYCLAGCEIVRDDNGNAYLTHHWVRPVTKGQLGTSCGAVPADWCQAVSVLDVIEVEFEHQSPIIGQPENWLMKPNSIRKLYSFSNLPALRPLSVDCAPLWQDCAVRDDQIRPAIAEMAQASLTLISPQNLSFSLELKEHSSDKLSRKIYASFIHNGHRFDRIKVTDPALYRLFKNQFPNVIGQTVYRNLRHGDQYFLTMSLSPFFNGFHYVLVAAVIDQTGYLNRTYR